MRRSFILGILVAVCAGVLVAQQTPAPAGGSPPAGAQGGRGRGGRQGSGGAPGGGQQAAAPNPADTYGTADTLFTMPEAGQGGGAGDPTAEQLAASPEAQQIIANARRIAGTDLVDEVNRFCTWNASANVPPGNSPETVQMFDNIYYSTTGAVGALFIKTSDGIILWDTLDSEEEAKTIIEPGMRKFGLDPTQIRLIIIGHHHRDHTGGLEYFQRMYNPKILMGKLDWDVIMTSGMHVRRGLDVMDGQKVTLGDTTVTLFLLPGHTPTSVSGIVPAKFQGRTLNILLLTASRFSTYASLAPFQRIFDEGKRANVETVFQVHPEINMLKTETIQALRQYSPTGRNPLLVTPAKAARYMDVELECGKARIAANKTALDKARTPEYYHTPEVNR